MEVLCFVMPAISKPRTYNDNIPSIKTALSIFNEELEKRTEGGDVGRNEKVINDMKLWQSIKGDAAKRRENTSLNFFQSFSMGSATGNKDDLGKAVGKYSQRCYYRGTLSKNTDTDKWILSISEVICRFADEFSFNDTYLLGTRSQDLGCWINDIENIKPPTRVKIPGSSRVCLQNIDYQELKKILASTLPNSCNNFFIYSDLKILNDDFLQKDIIIF